MGAKETFGERLKNLRGAMNQQELADALEISRASVGYYENGTRTPDIEILERVAKYFNVSTDYLLGLNVCKNPENEKKLSEMMEMLIGNLRGELPKDQEALIDIFTAIHEAYESVSMAELEESKNFLPTLESAILLVGACCDEAKRINDVIETGRYKEEGNPGYYYYASGCMDSFISSSNSVSKTIDAFLENILTETIARLKNCYDIKDEKMGASPK